MTGRPLLAHLYAVLGDGRLNIIGSRSAFEELASALSSLVSDGRPRELELAQTEMPHYGVSLGSLRCRRSEAALLCVVEGDAVSISGNSKGLLLLASTLKSRAEQWEQGGHEHLYPGWDFDGEVLVSGYSEELLIGGSGYLPPEMFGLPAED